MSRATNLRILEADPSHAFPKVPFRTANTILVNSVAVQSDDISEVSEAANHNKYVLVNTATKSIAQLSLTPHKSSSDGGILCGESFVERLAQLTDDYNPALYRAFTSKIGSFIVDSDDPSQDLFDQTIIRDEFEVCGGDENVLRSTTASIWQTWVDSITAPGARQHSRRACFLNPKIIPLWLLASAQRPAVRSHLAVSILRYLSEVTTTAIKEDDLNVNSIVKPCSKNQRKSSN